MSGTGDITDMKSLIAKVATGATLSEEEAGLAFDIIMSGNATPSQMGGFLMALRVRGETVDEITGAARVMRAKAIPVDAPDGTIDTCGTGGDGVGTYNISTAAALVLAACGLPVAKHGNRAMSSKSGAADVLGALGVNLDCDMALIRKALWEANIGFLMAPRHHLAMRNVGPTRVELGTRTIFNLMGPLSNPATARRQLLGVFARQWVEPLAHVLKRLGSEAAWIVHGSDGLDEITTTGPTTVAQLRDGEVTVFEVTPEEAGLPRASIEDLKGGDAQVNAEAIHALFDGVRSPYRDIVLLNAAAALLVAGRVQTLKDGVAQAAQAIDSGGARMTLQRLVAITNQGAAA
ncbi:anthranilate phosphoribosyltransferase [Azospirillum thermophilum]|uniref:Anthranilate phosphoribosyltransferase n=1 Tax=Azospirillum thermophilum TaxID=2202148 RepID=A0A2S2CKP7_9PROT|nr:anthranilate phosphoribosyltransferase [Azospirillum thermophilum]AWK85088.1 anthranilate phosphoribosyltransferase [Azospirillum thermophilum]